MGTPPCFSVIFTKGNNFHDFLFASVVQTGFTLKGKNLLQEEQIFFLEEQILSFESKPLLKREANM